MILWRLLATILTEIRASGWDLIRRCCRRDIQHSHWSSSYNALSIATECWNISMHGLVPCIDYAILCHKELGSSSKPKPTRRIGMGVIWLLLVGSLWHKDSWPPCTESSYYRRQLECWISWIYFAGKKTRQFLPLWWRRRDSDNWGKERPR